MRIIFAVITMFVGICLPQAKADNNEVALDQYFQLIVDDPHRAKELLQEDASYKARFYLAFLYATTLKGQEGASERASDLFLALKKDVEAKLKIRPRRFREQVQRTLAAPGSFLGGKGELFLWLRYLSLAATDQIGLMKTPIVIDCRIMIEDPSFFTVTYPSYIYDVVDFVPQSDCMQHYVDLPSSYQEFRDFTERNMATTFHNPDNLQRHGKRAHDRFQTTAVALFPSKLDGYSKYVSPLRDWLKPPCDIPFIKWGHLSLFNWHKFQEAKTLWQRAVVDLAAYYHQGLGIEEYQASRYAKVALAAFGGEWSNMSCPVGKLRNKILEGVPLSEIQREVADGHLELVTNQRAELGYDRAGSYLGLEMGGTTGEAESLLHISVTRPDVLAYLLPQFPSVETPNSFGKTSLMTAAQNNVADSVALLIDAGASINAMTRKRRGPVGLHYDHRTPLMYAAANAGLPVIKLLLDAGADIMAQDSKGNRALDYLTGLPGVAPTHEFDRGIPPVPGNAILSVDEMAEAKALLALQSHER